MGRWIAYIDDSKSNLEALSHFLSSEFQVDCFLSCDEFLTKYPMRQYEAILVDLHMPKKNGFETYEAIVNHNDYNGCAVLIISSDDSVEARVKSFELGAVDFLNRSSSIEQIIARINSKIHFFKKHRSIIEFENLRIDRTQLKVFLDRQELSMTFTEIKFLSHIISHFPKKISKEKMAKFIWGEAIVLDNTLYTHIFNLNSKLSTWPYEIRVLKGLGAIALVEKK